jgi:DNA mismatch endonuclease (patch repair protein)
MPDIVSKRKRSEVMAAVCSQGNRTTELRLIGLFRRHRITGWRRHWRIAGKPDFVFRSKHVAVFVDGCFWHGCPRCYRRPVAHRVYWDSKLRQSRERDELVTQNLRARGWHVLRVWEHELMRKNETRLLRKFEKALA